MEKLFDLYITAVNYWITMFQYPIDHDEVKALRNGHNNHGVRLDLIEKALRTDGRL